MNSLRVPLPGDLVLGAPGFKFESPFVWVVGTLRNAREMYQSVQSNARIMDAPDKRAPLFGAFE